MGWATFWAIFSQTHLVTLARTHARGLCWRTGARMHLRVHGRSVVARQVEVQSLRQLLELFRATRFGCENIAQNGAQPILCQNSYKNCAVEKSSKNMVFFLIFQKTTQRTQSPKLAKIRPIWSPWSWWWRGRTLRIKRTRKNCGQQTVQCMEAL
jgi:hypothetical protein